jgi:subtilisin family serine protease
MFKVSSYKKVLSQILLATFTFSTVVPVQATESVQTESAVSEDREGQEVTSSDTVMVQSPELTAPAPKETAPFPSLTEEDIIPNEFIVKYKSGEELSNKEEEVLGIQEVKENKDGTTLYTLQSDENPAEVLQELQNQSEVEYVEPNRKYTTFETEEKKSITNDTYVDQQWGLQSMNVPQAWSEIGDSSETVTVAVVDTGVDATHPDLSGRVDLDNGKNFTDKHADKTPYPSDWGSKDDQGHGTAVAGVIAALADNNQGVAGVAGTSNVNILPVKVMNEDGWGSTYDIAEGIRYAADKGADIINLSLGGKYSKTIADAVSYAQERDVLVVAAAGNEGTSVDGVYPAAAPGVLTVGAIAQQNQRANFSNFGKALDVMAPGVGIVTTTMTGKGSIGDDYTSVNGTSFAAPHAAGVAALYKIKHPEANAGTIFDALIKTANDLGPQGWDEEYGAGKIDASKALSSDSVEAVKILEPAANGNLAGQVTLKAQVNKDADKVNVVRFYLDEIKEANKIAEVNGQPGQTMYTAQWDTLNTREGAHTLWVVSYIGEEAQQQAKTDVWVRNNPQTGLMLKVISPDGEKAPGANITVSKKVEISQDETNPAATSPSYKYETVWTGKTDSEGIARIPSALNTDLQTLSVLVQGKFDAKDAPEGNTLFIYQRTLEGPGTFELKADQTVPVTFNTVNQSNVKTKHTQYFATIMDKNKVSLGTTTALNEEGKEVAPTIYMDKGVYNLFSYSREEDATYFMSKWGQEITTQTKEIKFDGTQTGQVSLDNETGGFIRGVLYLYNEQTDEVLGVNNVLSGKKLLVSAGSYNYWTDIEVADPAGGENWVYVLGSKNNKAEVKAQGQTKIQVGSIITLKQFEADEEALKAYYEKIGQPYVPKQDPYTVERRGMFFFSKHHFADAYNNELVGMYRGTLEASDAIYKRNIVTGTESVHKLDKQTERWSAQEFYFGDIYPEYKVTRKSDGYVVYDSGSLDNRPAFRQFYWMGFWAAGRPDVTPGEYEVQLKLQTNPLAGKELLQTRTNHVVDNGHEIRVKDEKGNSVRPFVWLYHLDKDEDGHPVWEWSFQQWADSKTKVLQVHDGVKLSNQENGNLAVIRYQNANGEYVFLYRQFTSLEELRDVQASADLQAVKIQTIDKDGQPLKNITKKDHEIIYQDRAGSQEANIATSIGSSYTKDKIYLEPGLYHFDANYITTADEQGRKSNYYLLAPNVNISNQGDNTVIFDASKTAKITLEPKVNGYHDFRGAALYPYSKYNNSMNSVLRSGHIFYIPSDVKLHVDMNLALGDPESPGYVWNYFMEMGDQSFKAGEEKIWKLAGTFKPQIAVSNSTIKAGENVTGSSSVVDEFGNKLMSVVVNNSTDFGMAGADNTAGAVDFVRLYNGEIKAVAVRDEEDMSVSHAQPEIDSKGIYPHLRVYKKEANGQEIRVFDQQKYEYYNGFNEKIGNLSAGQYRVELAMAASPNGPVATSKNEGSLTVNSNSNSGSNGTNSGSGSSGGVTTSPVTQQPTKESKESIGDDQFNKALEEAKKQNKTTVTFEMKAAEAVEFSINQLRSLASAQKSFEIQMKHASFAVPYNALDASLTKDAKSIEISAKPLNKEQAEQIIATGKNGSLLNLAGEIYELNMNIIKNTGEVINVSAFQAPLQVTLTVPLEARSKAAAGEVQVYHYSPEQKRWNLVGGTYNVKENTMMFQTTHFSQYALMTAEEEFMQIAAFKDIKGHWAEKDIQYMFEKGYVKGMKEGIFTPEGKVTRAQFALMLSKILSLPVEVGQPSTFKDVEKTHWAYGAINAIAKQNLVNGYVDGTFRPDRLMTRQEIASLIHRLMKAQGINVNVNKNALKSFKDSALIAEWAKDDVAAAVSSGMMYGRGQATFAPSAHITRAESAVLLKRVIEKRKQ